MRLSVKVWYYAILIVAVSLIPPLLSVFLMRKYEAQGRARLRAAMQAAAAQRLSAIATLEDNHHDLGYIIGDVTCRYNARSSFLRCAVNPEGPCEACRQYQPRSLEFQRIY